MHVYIRINVCIFKIIYIYIWYLFIYSFLIIHCPLLESYKSIGGANPSANFSFYGYSSLLPSDTLIEHHTTHRWHAKHPKKTVADVLKKRFCFVLKTVAAFLRSTGYFFPKKHSPILSKPADRFFQNAVFLAFWVGKRCRFFGSSSQRFCWNSAGLFQTYIYSKFMGF